MKEKLKALLEEKGISQYKLSKDTGIAQSCISDWCTGRSKPKMDKLLLLAKYFNIDISYFLEEQEER